LIAPGSAQALFTPVKSFQNSVDGISGAKPDLYGKLRNIHGVDYLTTKDIAGASPTYKNYTNKVSYNLYTKDATG